MPTIYSRLRLLLVTVVTICNYEMQALRLSAGKTEVPGKADNWRARSREGGQLVGRVQERRTDGGQGPGKADKWRAGSREGGQLGEGSREGGQLAGKVQGRRTTGGQGPGKADNWLDGATQKVGRHGGKCQ